MANYNIIGDIAIVKFDKKEKKAAKQKFARQLLKRKNINTVLEKTDKVSGRLRTIKTKHVFGKKTKETIHHENSCQFKLDVEKCYFSPRLSEERKQVAGAIGKNDKVLVMFSGVNPFGIAIAKLSKAKVVAIELGRECCKYAKENAKRNKVDSKIETIQGDVKKKVTTKLGKFDVIVMPRPNLKETFLKQAFSVSKKGTRIFYYCFGQKKELAKNLAEINKQAKKFKKRIKVNKIKRAGEIAPYTFRHRVDFVVS